MAPVGHSAGRHLRRRLLLASVLITGSVFGQTARQRSVEETFRPGHTITIEVTIEFSGTANALGYAVDLPPRWSFVRATSEAGDIGPPAGTTTRLEWAWTKQQRSPVVFSYTVAAPNQGRAPVTVKAEGILRQNRALRMLAVAPLNLAATSQD